MFTKSKALLKSMFATTANLPRPNALANADCIANPAVAGLLDFLKPRSCRQTKAGRQMHKSGHTSVQNPTDIRHTDK